MNKLVIITLIAAIGISITVYGFSLQEESTKLTGEKLSGVNTSMAIFINSNDAKYKNWCGENNGTWSKDVSSGFVCEYFDNSDYLNAVKEIEILENELIVPDKTSIPSPVSFQFSSDPFGHYEKWCNAVEGKYSVRDYSTNVEDSEYPISCMFDSLEERTKSREQLREYQDVRLEGELAKRLCLAYQKDDSKCLDGIMIHVELDMETNHLMKDKKIDGVYYEFRIIDGQDIQYRESHGSNPWGWKDAEIDR